MGRMNADVICVGTEVPIYDIKPLYQPNDIQSMLVNSAHFGSHLASTFSHPSSPSLAHNVVLMRNHGFTTIGISLKQAVYRAVYTHVNASVQSNAIILRNAFQGVSGAAGGELKYLSEGGELRYLDEEQTRGCMRMNDESQDRPWGLWVREVQANGLYVNEAMDFDPEADVEWT
jgi:hypothetical protein